MDKELLTSGYQLHPTRYSPRLGYSQLTALISGQPAQRYFDVKLLHIPTFDGRFYHMTNISRHELELKETFQVCLGKWSLENFVGNEIHGFSFGGVLQAAVKDEGLYCEFTSSAPIFKMKDDQMGETSLLFDEILDLVAEQEVKMTHHEDELYARLGKHDPHEVFLSCLVTLQKKLDRVPTSLRRERYRKTSALLQKVIKIVRDTDRWDGRAPTLTELLSPGA
jgi:hypothetical protein